MTPVTLALLSYALLLDMAIETFRSGSPLRWWVTGAVTAYLVLCVLVRSRKTAGLQRFSWLAGPTASLFVFLGLLAAIAWRPDGSARGVAMLGQSTATVLSAVTAATIAVAGIALLRVRAVPTAARWAIGALTLYAVGACLTAIAVGTPYAALFNGESFWRRLPFWLQGAVVGGLLLLPLGVAAHVLAAVMRIPARWRFQQIVALTMSLVMVASAFPHSARPPLAGVLPSLPAVADQKSLAREIDKTRAAAAPRNLPAVLDSLQQLNLEAVRSTFDLSAKARELGPDVNQIFSFVRDRVRDEVYEGMLRGDRGTLMAMAGNSVDKSLLLGSLLRQNGFAVRYVRGRLARERAESIVRQMFASAKQTGDTRPAGASDQIGKVPEQLRTVRDGLAQVTQARWRANLDRVATTLERDGLRLGDRSPVLRERLLDEAANHLWVEYRAGDRWVPLDPTFSGAESGQTFTSGSEIVEGIPRSLFHVVTIRVKVEEREDGRIVARDVLRHDAPAAELNGSMVTLTIPTGSSGHAWSALPILQIRDKTVRGEPFPTGTRGPQSPAGGLGQALGRFSDFLGDDTAKAKPVRDVTGVWLEFDFTAPSGQAETVRREVFDRIGPAARLQKREASAPLGPLTLRNAVPLALTGIFACSFSTGILAPALPLARLSQYREVVQSVAPLISSGRTPTHEEAQKLSTTLAPAVPAILSSFAAAVHVMSQQSRALLRHDDLVLYEATPRLAIASLESTSSDDGKTVTSNMTLDLRRNDLRVVSERLTGSAVAQANMARGVLDGVVEHVLLGDLTPASVGQFSPPSTVAVMDRADAAGAHVTSITTSQAVERLSTSDTIKARMLGSLAKDVALVVPARALPIEGRDRLAWWRVNLGSGEVLGVMENGLHGQIGEYLATTSQVAFIADVSLFIIGVTVTYSVFMTIFLLGIYVGRR